MPLEPGMDERTVQLLLGRKELDPTAIIRMFHSRTFKDREPGEHTVQFPISRAVKRPLSGVADTLRSRLRQNSRIVIQMLSRLHYRLIRDC